MTAVTVRINQDVLARVSAAVIHGGKEPTVILTGASPQDLPDLYGTYTPHLDVITLYAELHYKNGAATPEEFHHGLTETLAHEFGHRVACIARNRPWSLLHNLCNRLLKNKFGERIGAAISLLCLIAFPVLVNIFRVRLDHNLPAMLIFLFCIALMFAVLGLLVFSYEIKETVAEHCGRKIRRKFPDFNKIIEIALPEP